MKVTTSNKPIIGWTMYDWAVSAFSTTVMAGFFPVFFKQYWSHGSDAAVTTARLGAANSLAGLLIALIAPAIGAIADRGSAKKKFLCMFAYLGVLMTASLFLVQQGDWKVAIFCYTIATIGYAGGNIFYDSLLTTVAPKNRMDFISSLGFSIGYLGGGILFAINVWMTLSPATFGLADVTEAVQYSFLSVAIWWGLFSVPIFLFVEEPPQTSKVSNLVIIRDGLKQLRKTFKEIRTLKPIFMFLIAYWLYIDGVDTIIVMSINYGMSIGFQSTDLILALLLVQFIGFPAAIGFGYLAGKIGTKRSIYIAISIYFMMSVLGAFIQSTVEFYILAVFIGLVQGGLQALSRSFYAKIIPKEKSAEYFGFYNMIGKFAAIIGPVLIGGTALLARQAGAGNDLASRISISSISVLFLAGGFFLIFVKEEVKPD
jgi:MFS transporter, UMF1 family